MGIDVARECKNINKDLNLIIDSLIDENSRTGKSNNKRAVQAIAIGAS